jgi:hypothetical protein
MMDWMDKKQFSNLMYMERHGILSSGDVFRVLVDWRRWSAPEPHSPEHEPGRGRRRR